MRHLKIFSFIMNTFFCSVQKIEVFPWTASNDKFYRLMLQYKGYPFKVFINDIKVPKRSTYVCGQYDDLNSVKIRVRGILSSKTYFIETNSSSNLNGYLLNFPALEKPIHLREKNIQYGISRMQGNLRPKKFKIQNTKKELNKKLSTKMSLQNSEVALKFNRNYSLNNKDYQLNNTTNRPTSWRN